MPSPRLLAPWTEEQPDRSAIYHVVSRVVDRRFLLGPEEKEYFTHLMQRYATFCGVRILTHCIMDNHFHILVEIPPKNQQHITDHQLIERLKTVQSAQSHDLFTAQIQILTASTAPEAKQSLDELRTLHTRRMWDLPHFIKSIKQHFSRWYNRRHRRKGTLWEERYKSTLVENGLAARTIAAYIDLNPVRAGLTDDPAKYRWCGYAQAVAGEQTARQGIHRTLSELDSDHSIEGWAAATDLKSYKWRTTASRYRLILFEDGLEQQAPQSTRKRKGLTQKQLEKETQRGGHLPLSEILRHRTRYLTDGAVLGTKHFINETIDALKGNQLPENRKARASRPRDHLKFTKLHTLRNLRQT